MKLNNHDLINCLDFIHGLLAVNSLEDMTASYNKLSHLLNYKGITVFKQSTYNNGHITPEDCSLHNIPQDWIELYTKNNFGLKDPVFKHALSSKKIATWSSIFNYSYEGKEVLDCAKDFGLYNGVTGGSGKPSQSSPAHIVSVSFCDEYIPSRDLAILNHVIPHIGQAACRFNFPTSIHLTQKEKSTLSWAAIGKTSWEISLKECVSEAAIKKRLRSTYHKLDANSRSQAIAKAIKLGLIKV